jgi:hypothetical protein
MEQDAEDRFFAKQPDKAEVLPFNNEKFYGLIVRWGLKNIGFGELTFYVDKETGEGYVDKECMGDETCGRIIDLLREDGTLVKEAKFVKVTPGLSVSSTAINEQDK